MLVPVTYSDDDCGRYAGGRFLLQSSESIMVGSSTDLDTPLQPWLKPPVGEKFTGRPVWACPGVVLFATSGGKLNNPACPGRNPDRAPQRSLQPPSSECCSCTSSCAISHNNRGLCALHSRTWWLTCLIRPFAELCSRGCSASQGKCNARRGCARARPRWRP